ncbi:LOW QUALITY PROTEIN: hormonally up-regulated neu tumor-associated kinase [Dromiciops gliroides]|uniref:LOW QUALITY PROTEIN: hormonally up-regulated neu tumor-associated kinase n=1 Tax=Dromiciops gliroides TaxID=33562 RepID=UPI001CC77CFC|nr:LOW QUALITY PROTEIN: hormonally up-regulated neu tumor-associated kinase [Dromiciops gliroides]
MPAAAGDGLLSEPPAPGSGLGGGDGGGEDAKPPLASAGSFLPPWVSAVSREQLRDFQHNKRVGNYLIGSRKLGEGSFAKVREGLHVLTGEKVAVKIIDKKRAKKDTYVTKNLRREGQIQQMIRHPNITQLLDILETENSYYLVMELCPGGNLMHKIYEKKRLEEHETRRYIRQLILAVEHLHRAGVVHRDLKIENLLLDEDNNIKLIDFGLSNYAGILGYSDPFSTQCGSPAYAAPELLARKKYGSKIDVWSIGVNMFAMLTGTLPFTVEPFSLRALYQKMVDKEMNPLPTQLSTAATNFLRSLLEPDPAKRPNIQQALANRWLNENCPGKAPYNITYPNRIHLEDLSQSVVLHMTEKLGYKNSDVINTVLSNRACHILAIYFLLNKKLERYLSGLRKSNIQDNIFYKNQLYQIEKYGLNTESSEDKKLKEQEKKGDFLHRPFPKTLDKNLTSYKQPSACLVTQIQNTKARKDQKAAKPSFPEKDSFRGLSPFHEAAIGAKTGCIASCSLEYLEIQHPRTPRITKKQELHQQETASMGIQSKDNHLILDVVRSFESVDREDQIELLSPTHHYRILSSPVNILRRNSNERTLSPVLPLGSISPSKVPPHSTPVSFAYEEKNSPSREEGMCSPPAVSANGTTTHPLGSPNCVKSRGRFPMMGVGQMLRKRNQTIQSSTDKPLEARLPPLHQINPGNISFDTNDGVKGQC